MSTRLLSFSSFLQASCKLSTKKVIFTRKNSVLAFQQKKSSAFWGSSFSSYRFLKIYSHCKNFETLIRFSGCFYNFSTSNVNFSQKLHILSAFQQKKLS